MKKQKINNIFIIIIIIVFAFALCAGCNKVLYGETFNNISALKSNLQEHNISLRYPAIKAEKMSFMSVYDTTSKTAIGYKIYAFGAPFYISVYGYNYTFDSVLSDDIKRLEAKDALKTINGEANLYVGDYHGETLFLIATINIDNAHYEVRVIANKERKESKLVNAIFYDNQNYVLAINALISTIEEIK